MLSKVLVLLMAGSNLATCSVQTPTVRSCTSTGIVSLSKITIENAKLGQTMTVNFAFTISQPLESDPKADVTVRNEEGFSLPCLSAAGSCIYRLCGGTKDMEKELGKPWNNECPVPAISEEESISVEFGPEADLLMPFAPTTVNVRVEVSDGGTVVGCETFDVKIEAA